MPAINGTIHATGDHMTDRIQHTTELITDRSVGIFTLIATSEHVRGVRETDLIEVHNVNTGEMFEMADWEAMIDGYPDWEAVGVLCWRELQDLVHAEGC